MARHSSNICYLPKYLPSCISLHLTKLTRTMQCCGYANGGPVVLGICLGAVAAQKKPAQIRRLATKNREQFRVRAGLTCKALPGGENPDIRSGHGYPLCVGTAQ